MDPDDYERLSKYKWHAHAGTQTFYAARRIPGHKTASQHRIWMHRQIIQAPDGIFVDHINHNGLDNRKANLRTATYIQNSRNRQKTNKNTWSKYKGVTFDYRRRKWLARIVVNHQKRHLGSFNNEFQAAKAYDTAAKKYHAEFAVLNFPLPR